MERPPSILIFGYGNVAQHRYVPMMDEIARSDPSVSRECIDPNSGLGCVDVTSWWTSSKLKLSAVDKILILSPPGEHHSNLSSIVNAYAGLRLPEIYLEKPIYLEAESDKWTALLRRRSDLEHCAFYVDHYRLKPALDWFEEHRHDTLGSIGSIREIGFVSLEAQEFWDSEAFSAGYFLEHACHLVGMLDRVFPGLGGHPWTPRRTRDWRVWEQSGRPPSCKRDSACLLYMSLSQPNRPGFAPRVELTAAIGKGMSDAKVLYLRGERGHAQLWFNKGESVVAPTGGKPVKVTFPPGDSYRAVVDAIFSNRKDRQVLLSLRQGMAEQEKVIAIRRHFPERVRTYDVGEIPSHIAGELARMGISGDVPVGER